MFVQNGAQKPTGPRRGSRNGASNPIRLNPKLQAQALQSSGGRNNPPGAQARQPMAAPLPSSPPVVTVPPNQTQPRQSPIAAAAGNAPTAAGTRPPASPNDRSGKQGTTLDQYATNYARGGLSALPNNVSGTLKLGADPNNPFTVQNQAGVQVLRGPSIDRPMNQGQGAPGSPGSPQGLTPAQAINAQIDMAKLAMDRKQMDANMTKAERDAAAKRTQNISSAVESYFGDVGMSPEQRSMATALMQMPQLEGLSDDQAASAISYIINKAGTPEAMQADKTEQATPSWWQRFGTDPNEVGTPEETGAAATQAAYPKVVFDALGEWKRQQDLFAQRDAERMRTYQQ
jgi:hypothetical protein